MSDHVCAAALLFERTKDALAVGALGYGLLADPDDIECDVSGVWMLNNGEYAAPIFFCPWCGDRLEKVSQ